jgi:hypothetical protein
MFYSSVNVLTGSMVVGADGVAGLQQSKFMSIVVGSLAAMLNDQVKQSCNGAANDHKQQRNSGYPQRNNKQAS